MKARIIRLEESEQGTLGVLLIDNQYICSTLEPDSNDPVKSQIPVGTYKCIHRISPNSKYKNTYEIIVPGHTAVLFHTGNREQDTQMCVILGMYPDYYRDQRSVMMSQIAFQRFMNILNNVEEFELEIITIY